MPNAYARTVQFVQQSVVGYLDGAVLPDGLDVVPEAPQEAVVPLVVGVELPDPGRGVDQARLQLLRGLLQQDLEALDHVHQDLLPDTCTWQIVIFTSMLSSQ